MTLRCLTLSLIFFLGGCGEEEEASTFKSSADLTISDFSADGVTDLTDEELIEVTEDTDLHESLVVSVSDSTGVETNLRAAVTTKSMLRRQIKKMIGKVSVPSFGLDEPKARFDESDENLNCMAKAFKPIEGGVGFFEFGVDGDLGPCLEALFSAFGVRVEYAKLSGMTRVECDGGDFTAVDGLDIGSVLTGSAEDQQKATEKMEQVTECPAAGGSYRIAHRMVDDTKMTDESGESSVRTQGKEGIFASDSGLCKMSLDGENGATASDCTFYSQEQEETSSGEEKSRKKTYFKAQMNGVKEDLDDDYLTEGTVQFVVNQHQGSVTFDGTATPEFTISVDGREISGSFSE